MKKLSAVILTLSILFLCACAGQEEPETTTAGSAAAPSMTAPQTTEAAVITEWGTKLLPEDFPAPPEGTYGFIIEEGDPAVDEGNFLSKWVRIQFTCPEQNFHTFTNSLIENGYVGGSKKITNGTYYSDGTHGFWQNGKNLIRINSSQISLNNDLTVIIDIVPCTDNFPEALLQYFPKFNGYTAGSGTYCGHDASEASLTKSFENGFSPYWHWDFRFSNGFAGVTLEDFESYYKTLGDMGFSGVITSSTVDSCNIISVDVIKEIGGTTYGVFMLFNQSLRTLDIVYTNNPNLLGVGE